MPPPSSLHVRLDFEEFGSNGTCRREESSRGWGLHFPDDLGREHLFTGLLAICRSSLGNCLLGPFINGMTYLLLSHGSSLYIQDLDLQQTDLHSCSRSMGCLLTILAVFSEL